MSTGEYLFTRAVMIAFDVGFFAVLFATMVEFGLARSWALGIAVVFTLSKPPTRREMALDAEFRKRS